MIPKRVVERFTELTTSEVNDLFLATQTISKVVEREYGGTSLTIAIQDGPEAGQSVPVHIVLVYLVILSMCTYTSYLAKMEILSIMMKFMKK